MVPRIEEYRQPANPGSRPRPPGSSWARLAGLLLLLTLATVLLVALPTKTWLIAYLSWSERLGVWSLALFIPVYVVATILFIPGLILTIGAGFLFGLVQGTVAVSIGSTVGVAAAFLIGRTLARQRVETMVRSREQFRAIDAAVGREGFKIVFLMRLSPIFPFNVLNYALGLTTVRFGDYVLASWIGMLPGTIVYVYIGTLAQNLAALAAGDAGRGGPKAVLLVIGLAATLAVAVLVTRIAQRALREAIGEGTGTTR